jgi:cytochrome c oxidase assembly factor CtaG
MIQHLLLMTLAPPFIWLGAPGNALAHGLPHRFVEEFLARISRWSPMKLLGNALANPTLCWLAASATLIGWHIPTLFALGLQSEMWHGIEQASFLTSGLLFWWPVVRPRPTVSNWSEWPILLYLFLATLPCDILSGFLVFCDRVVYPVYFGVVYLVAGTIVAARLLAPQNSHPYSFPISDSQLSVASHTTPQHVEVV